MSTAVVQFDKGNGQTRPTAAVPGGASVQDRVIAALRNIYDPELRAPG